MLKVTLRNLAAHKIRLLLTGVSVLLGVAFVAGTLIFTDTMTKRFDQLFDGVGTQIAVDVRAKKLDGAMDDGQNSEPIPAAMVERLAQVEGTRDVIGNVMGYAAVVGKDGKVIGAQGAPQFGLNWIGEQGDYTIVEGRPPNGPTEVALDTATAERGGFGLGDKVKIISTGAPVEMTVTALVDTGNMMGAGMTLFDTDTAQRMMLKPGFFSDIQMGSTGPSETELRDRVQAVLPDNLEAITGEQLREESQETVAMVMGFFRTLLLAFALVSIFVGAFIIFNTFSMLVAQRTRELALLRAVGAARSQVTRAVLGEAVAVGFVGSTLGLLGGAGLALVLNAQMADAGDGGLIFTATPVIVSYVVGIGVTVASAYFPARKAAKTPPVAAMRDDVALPQRSLRIRLAFGALLTAVGAALITLGLVGDGSGTAAAALVGVGALGVFLGVAMLAPAISLPVVRVLGWPFARLMRLPGRLAQQNALRNPRRTAATASALMIGLALITTVNVLGASVRASVDQQLDQGLGADFVVSANGMGGIPADAVEKLRTTPGVDEATTLYTGNATYDGDLVWYTAAGAGLAKAVKLSMESGTSSPGRDGILLDSKMAAAQGLSVGDSVSMTFPDRQTVRLRVAGIYEPNNMAGQRLISDTLHLEHTGRARVMMVMVDTGGDTSPKKALTAAVADNPTVEVRDLAGVKEQARGQIDGMVVFLTILLVMSVIIAAFGVVNTLALSVIERTREIGLLRAVGMSRRQLRRMIRVEAVVIAVFGAVLGMAIGIGFGASLQQALSEDGIQVLSVPFVTLAIYLGVAAVIGVLAAMWPAWRAGRMDVLDAISTE